MNNITKDLDFLNLSRKQFQIYETKKYIDGTNNMLVDGFYIFENKRLISEDFDLTILDISSLTSNSSFIQSCKRLIDANQLAELLYLSLTQMYTIEFLYNGNICTLEINRECEKITPDNCLVFFVKKEDIYKPISFQSALDILEQSRIITINDKAGYYGYKIFSKLEDRHYNRLLTKPQRKTVASIKHDTGFYVNDERQNLLCSKCGNKIPLHQSGLVPVKCDECHTKIVEKSIFQVGKYEEDIIIEKFELVDENDASIIFPNVYINKKGGLSISKSNNRNAFTIDNSKAIEFKASETNFDYTTLKNLVKFLNKANCTDIQGMKEALKDAANRNAISKFLKYNGYEIICVNYILKDFKEFVNFLKSTDARNGILLMHKYRKIKNDIDLDEFVQGSNDLFTLSLKMFLIEQCMFSDTTLSQALQQLKGLKFNEDNTLTIENKEEFQYSLLKFYENNVNKDAYYKFNVKEGVHIQDFLEELCPLILAHEHHTVLKNVNTTNYSQKSISEISSLLKYSQESYKWLYLFTNPLTEESVSNIVKNINEFASPALTYLANFITSGSNRDDIDRLNEFIDFLNNKKETISWNYFEFTLKDIQRMQKAFRIFTSVNEFEDIQTAKAFQDEILSLNDDDFLILTNGHICLEDIQRVFIGCYKRRLDFKKMIFSLYFFNTKACLVLDIFKYYDSIYDLIKYRKFNYNDILNEYYLFKQLAKNNEEHNATFTTLYNIDEKVVIENQEYIIKSPISTLDLIVSGTTLKNKASVYSQAIESGYECILFLNDANNKPIMNLSVDVNGNILNTFNEVDMALVDKVEGVVKANDNIMNKIVGYYTN